MRVWKIIREYDPALAEQGTLILSLPRVKKALKEGKRTRQVNRAIAFVVRNPHMEYSMELARDPNCPPEVKAAVEKMFDFLTHPYNDGLFGCLAGDF